VVHEIRDADDRACRHRERLDELRVSLGRRRQPFRVVDVVREADRDASPIRFDERSLDQLRKPGRRPQVVEGKVERPRGRGKVLRDSRGDLIGRLTAVGQSAKANQLRAARCAALCARFQL
jgi:hypothetical protein